METQKAHILVKEHESWLNKLLYYAADVDLMQTRLENIASQVTTPAILVQVEHFQNQFTLRREQIDEMHHSIRDHSIYIDNKLHADHMSGGLELGDHAHERETMQTFEEAFNQMRVEFIDFWSKAAIGE